jgi:hypothetical protein
MTIDNLTCWARAVFVLGRREDQSLGALAIAGVETSDLEEAIELGYVKRYWLVSGKAVFRSTVKGRKTLSTLRSKQQLAYSKAAVSAPREPVEHAPYVPDEWVNPRPESMNAFNILSKGAI